MVLESFWRNFLTNSGLTQHCVKLLQIDATGYADRNAGSGSALVEEWHHIDQWSSIEQNNSDVSVRLNSAHCKSKLKSIPLQNFFFAAIFKH